MKKIAILSLITFIILGCGGGGGSGSSTTSSASVQTPEVIKGIAYDGLIYNAKVEIFDGQGNVIATTTTSSSNDNLGSFSINIKNLPKHYYIKITGGIDAGSDDTISSDDYNSTLILKSINSGFSFVSVTPVTTLVAELVKKGYSIQVANQIVNKALGIEQSNDLSALNPKNNILAKKAAKTVIVLAKILPGEMNQNLKKISKILTTKKIANLNSIDPVDLNIAQIIGNDASKEIVDNYEKNKNLINRQINEAINSIYSKDKTDIVTNIAAVETLKECLEEKNNFTVDDVMLYKNKLKSVLDKLNNEKILYNINDVKKVVKENLNANISETIDEIKKLSSASKISDKNRKLLYQALINIAPSFNVHELDGYDLDVLNVNSDDIYKIKIYYSLIAPYIINNLNTDLNNLFVLLKQNIIDNYFVQTIVNEALRDNVQNRIKINILKTYFYRNNEINKNVFDEMMSNNLENLMNEDIEPFLLKINNKKSLLIFETLIKYVDLKNYKNDFNKRIIPLYSVLNEMLNKSNVALNTTLQKFEKTFKKVLLKGNSVSEKDIQSIIVKVNNQKEEIKPVMFPDLLGNI